MTDTAIRYEHVRNPNLPWGYWLLAEPNRPGIVDETGEWWPSLRHYLWQARLGMAKAEDPQLDTHCEVLLAVLAAIDRRVVHIEERVIDLFKGAWDLARHYGAWLEGHGLVEGGLSGALTLEGRAMLVMLASTRAVGSAAIPIGLPTIEPRRGLDAGRGVDEREAAMTAIEAFAARQPDRFMRDTLAGQPAIKLIGLPEGGNVPLTRVLWSIELTDAYARDRLFAWLAHRIDRWPTWAEVARSGGARALTAHLLNLRFADEPTEPG